jgi:4-amino-4-deoxy-L-arabinose transferase-like glycosyltransferase
VGRNFVKDGFNLMMPKYDDLSNIQTGVENPNGYRFVEFPIYNAIFAGLYKIAPILPLEIYGRLTSIVFSLAIIAIIYYLSLKEHSRTAAIFSSLLYAILPFFVFFSRVVLPETTALAFMFIAIWLLYLFLKNNNYILFILSIIMYAFALLVKPTIIFYSIAIGYLFIIHYQFDVFKKWQSYVYPILGLIPLIAWRMYIQQYPEGIPSSSWLIGYVNTYQGLEYIFFKPAYFRWILMERLGVLIFGIYLSGFFILGLIAKTKKFFMISIALSALAYLLTFQGGNLQHEYYQTLILPAIALITGIGIAQVLDEKSHFNKVLAYPTIVGVIVLSFVFSYYRVKDYYNYSQDLVQIAKLIDTFTKESDLIVTDTTGDTTLLYLADRKGAPATYKSIPELKKTGYSYFVTNKKDVSEDLKKQGYKILVDNDKISIIKL